MTIPAEALLRLFLSLSLEFTCSNGFSDALSVFSAVDKWPKAPPCSRSIPTPGTNKSANLCNVTNSFCQKNAGEVKDRSDSNFDKAVSTCHFRLPVFSPHPISEPWNANRLMASFVRDSPEEACCLKLTKNDKHGRWKTLRITICFFCDQLQRRLIPSIWDLDWIRLEGLLHNMCIQFPKWIEPHTFGSRIHSDPTWYKYVNRILGIKGFDIPLFHGLHVTSDWKYAQVMQQSASQLRSLSFTPKLSLPIPS